MDFISNQAKVRMLFIFFNYFKKIISETNEKKFNPNKLTEIDLLNK